MRLPLVNSGSETCFTLDLAKLTTSCLCSSQSHMGLLLSSRKGFRQPTQVAPHGTTSGGYSHFEEHLLTVHG